MDVESSVGTGGRIALGALGILIAAFVLASGLHALDDSVPIALLIGVPGLLLLDQARRRLDR